MVTPPKVLCENPDPDKKPVRIARWKYDLVRQAILSVLHAAPEGVALGRLSGLVRAELMREEVKRLGSVSWYTVVVKLDLEAKGLVERVAGTRPQVIRAAG